MNEKNPYSVPQAEVRGAASAALDIPEDIARPIKHGWIAAIVSGVFTLLATVIGMAGKSMDDVRFGAWNLIDVVLIFGLAFGIYRKSRVAATVMFGYFLLSKIMITMQAGMLTGIVMGLVFLILYFRAMVGTYRYHAFVAREKRFPSPPKRRISDDPMFSANGPGGDRSINPASDSSSTP